MSVAKTTIVNQRLYFCRLHLHWLEEQLSDQKLPVHVLEQSLGESLLLHLVLAYRAYLSEIAESCSSTEMVMFSSAIELRSHLDELGHSCASAIELTELEKQKSWLSHILKLHNDLYIEFKTPTSLGHGAGIPVRQIVKEDEGLSLEFGKKSFDFLNELIERQRQHLEEW